MKFYRIKQISETQFIPQVRDYLDIFKIKSLSSWEGIQYAKNIDSLITWKQDLYQEKRCCVFSLLEAHNIIKDYKKGVKRKSKYPKYHKI